MEATEDMQTIGDQMRSIREALGMTQEQLAERSSLTQSMIAEIENGKRPNLNLSTIRKLAEGLSCEPIVQILPKKDIPEIVNDQIQKIAQKLISTSSGSAAIELQLPSQKVIDDELKKIRQFLKQKGTSMIWQKI